MAASGLPPLPPQLKPVQHFLRTAQELDKREPVVAYYCRLYAMQAGMKIDSKNPECRKFLCKLMDQLEAMKKQLGDNEAVTQEIVGCAHVENYALKMFLYADNEDRAGRFHKNMIKSFYTASLLIDVLTVFGELTDENVQHRKYARWKAAYIHNCLKNGETPQSGPIGLEGEFCNPFVSNIAYSSNSCGLDPEAKSLKISPSIPPPPLHTHWNHSSRNLCCISISSGLRSRKGQLCCKTEN